MIRRLIGMVAVAAILFAGANGVASTPVEGVATCPVVTTTTVAPSTTVAATTTTRPATTTATTGGFPTAANTGVPTGTVLTASGSLIIDIAGTIVDSLDISGTVTINANNVVLKRSRVRGSDWNIVNISPTVTGVQITDVEIDGLGTTAGANGINGPGTFTRVDIHGIENGLNADGPFTMQDSYIHGLLAPGSPHYDGIQVDGGTSGVIIRHNTIIDSYDQTSAVMIDNYFGPISNVQVDNNRLVGGGYTVYSDGQFTGGPITGVSFTNNRLGSGFWGYDSIVNNTPVWSGNVDDVTGAAVPL